MINKAMKAKKGFILRWLPLQDCHYLISSTVLNHLQPHNIEAVLNNQIGSRFQKNSGNAPITNTSSAMNLNCAQSGNISGTILSNGMTTKKIRTQKNHIRIPRKTQVAAVDSGERERYNLNKVEKNLHPDEEVPL
jgi:hypothetical protein